MEWGIRPSRMTAERTPERTASTAQSILGIIPPWMTPSFTSPGISEARAWGIRVSSSAGR